MCMCTSYSIFIYIYACVEYVSLPPCGLVVLGGVVGGVGVGLCLPYHMGWGEGPWTQDTGPYIYMVYTYTYAYIYTYICICFCLLLEHHELFHPKSKTQWPKSGTTWDGHWQSHHKYFGVRNKIVHTVCPISRSYQMLSKRLLSCEICQFIFLDWYQRGKYPSKTSYPLAI